MNPLIVKGTGCFWKILLADLNYLLVNFHHINVFNSAVSGQLTDYSPVTRTDNKHVFYMGIYRHGNMNNHFVINELVLFRKHHIAVKSEKSAEFLRLKNVNALKIAFAAVKLFVHLNGQLYVFCMKFTEP